MSARRLNGILDWLLAVMAVALIVLGSIDLIERGATGYAGLSLACAVLSLVLARRLVRRLWRRS